MPAKSAKSKCSKCEMLKKENIKLREEIKAFKMDIVGNRLENDILRTYREIDAHYRGLKSIKLVDKILYNWKLKTQMLINKGN